ncbi:TraM recognition domain-containing protein [Phaeacidiphilus oryzae]|uniref:TraM recognition domain-containing protein n=1 Tax=Phaeacidiphilus oryzae TaxID=348818 RepID=UPI000689B360|nr:TraM recognition domain-containing protein [Phaeacidiphilus oryzae]
MNHTATGGGPLGRWLLDPTGPLSRWPQHLAPALTAHAPALAATAAGTYALTAAARRLLHHRAQRRLTADGYLTEILAPPEIDPSAAEAFWSHLVGLLRPWWSRAAGRQTHLVLEYRFTTRGLALCLWAPGTLPPVLLERAVEAAWPGAHTRPRPLPPPRAAPPPDPHRPGPVHTTGGVLRLARPEILPLHHQHETDPLRALLAAGSAVAGGEEITVQVLARPATGARAARAKHRLRAWKSGRTGPHRATALLDWLTHQPQRTGSPHALDPEHGPHLRAALTKAAGPQWETCLRYAATARTGADGDPSGARGRARSLAHATASSFAVYSGRNWYARHRLPHPYQVMTARHFPLRGDLLSVPELAALAHLPLDVDAPGVARAGARSTAPPIPIPAPGPHVKPLGRAELGPPRRIGLAVPDARHHLHIMGATGSGKSTLLAQLALADADAGRGVLVVDPKGDLVLDLLSRLPEHALDRTVLLDPGDHAPPPRLNVLEGDRAAADVVTDNLVGIFRRIFTAFWGPRTDDVMRAACLTLMTSPTAGAQVTLADIPRLLTEAPYRHRAVAGLSGADKTLRGFWTWYEQLSEPSRAAAIGPLMNKLRAFLLRSFVTDTIASGPSTFDLDHVLDGGIALIRLPKGVLGEETCRLLGSFIVAKTWQAAAHRADAGEHQRRDAALILDEAHNFLTLPYPLEDMLAEARGYRLSLVLAHQNLAQLPTDLREGISANARSKVFFNASPEDARALERHVAPHLTAHDLSHLGAYQAAARLVADAANTPAFTLRTDPLPAPVRGRATAARHASRRNFGPGAPTRHRQASGAATPPKKNRSS